MRLVLIATLQRLLSKNAATPLPFASSFHGVVLS
jgi:hypothetical protein